MEVSIDDILKTTDITSDIEPFKSLVEILSSNEDFHYTVNELVYWLRRVVLSNDTLHYLLRGYYDRWESIEGFAKALTAQLFRADLKGNYVLRYDNKKSSLILTDKGIQLPNTVELDKYSFNIDEKKCPDCFNILEKRIDVANLFEKALKILMKPIVYGNENEFTIVYLHEIISINDEKVVYNNSSLKECEHIEYYVDKAVGCEYLEDDKEVIIYTKGNRMPVIEKRVIANSLESVYSSTANMRLDSFDLRSSIIDYYNHIDRYRLDLLSKATRKIETLYEDETAVNDFDNNQTAGAIQSVFYDTNAIAKGEDYFVYPDGDVHAYDDYDSEGYHIHSDGERSECFSYGCALQDTSRAAFGLKEELMEKYHLTEYDLYDACRDWW